MTETMLIEFMREKVYKPLNVKELQEALNIQDGDAVEELTQLLNAMENEGVIVCNRANRYGVPDRMNLVVGRLQVKAKGFGFVLPDDPIQSEKGDVFINPSDMGGGMNGDKVVARVHGKVAGPRIEGAVIRVLKRAVRSIVGTFVPQGEQYAFVQPDDPRLGTEVFVAQADFGDAKEGQKVVVEIMHYPEGWRSAQGRITEVIGYPDEPGVDILTIIRKHGLPEAFPEAVIQQANDIADTISEDDLVGRRDIRDRRMVTIDGEDAKDLDDAVSIERLANGNYLLGVHIADVGYYVREGSELDKEAYNRATSVYLVDRVIPMLPQRLSNGICSLNPQVDRLTLTCDMEWSPNMELVNHEIYPSIIKTKERMTYTNVRKILTDKDPEMIERYRELVGDFEMMEELAMKLRDHRFRRGAIDFDFDETKIIVDKAGKPVEIKKRERSIAEMIIEEFMLAANETVAEHFNWLGVPFLYRIHEEPDGQRIGAFNDFIQTFGYRIKGLTKKLHPNALQNLLEEIKGKPEERVISTVMLRSLKQARYSNEPLGHFGLAAEFYSHFTSPIRRYPDLVIHRVIREVIDNQNSLRPERKAKLTERMPEIATHSSERERQAVEAERETDNLKKVEFMEDKIGEEFEGTISGITSFGIFVELSNSIEGLAHISFLGDDYYHHDEKSYSLIGERTGRVFRIGDPVKIRVDGVSKANRTIDFRILEGGTLRGTDFIKKMRAERAERDRKARGGQSRRKEYQKGNRPSAVGAAGASKTRHRKGKPSTAAKAIVTPGSKAGTTKDSLNGQKRGDGGQGLTSVAKKAAKKKGRR